MLCCTTTLAAGVNLPAHRVIIDHPANAQQQGALDRSTYLQMVGRAGRTGLVDVGEAFLICMFL